MRSFSKKRSSLNFLKSTLLLTFILCFKVYSHNENQQINSVKVSKEKLRQTPYILSTDGGEVQFKVIAYRDTNNEDIAMAELTLAPGYYAPLHTHQSSEWIYLLAGSLEQNISGIKKTIHAGQLEIIPANQLVDHEVISDNPAKMIIIWQPASEVDLLLRGVFHMKAVIE